MKKLIVISFSILLISCTSLSYNFTQQEFVDEYYKTVKAFDSTLAGPFGERRLKKLRRRFIYLKKQLHRNNDEYERINKSLVDSYTRKIDEYISLIEDLKD